MSFRAPSSTKKCRPPDRSSPFMRRCDASLRLMSCIEIVFETQMLYAAATAPHKLQGLYPNFDMPFDIVRGHHLIRRFGLHTLGDHWLIGHQKQRASRNVVGKSCSKDCCHRANTPPYFFPSFAWKPSIDQLGHARHNSIPSRCCNS